MPSIPNTAKSPPPAGERLQKHLAKLGLGSRRAVEEWIVQGKITIDGRVAQLGDRVGEHNRIAIAGQAVAMRPAAARRVLLYHKPEGEISARKDPANRPTVFRRLPTLDSARWVAVGRLDLNSSGLLLFTTDGELANRLMHPRFGLEREYLCRVYGKVDAAAIKRLREGVVLDGIKVRFQRVARHPGRPDASAPERRNQWYSVVVCEGKYREVRRLWAAVGCQLSRLLRVRYGSVLLPPTLKPGDWQELPPAAIEQLRTAHQCATDAP